MIRLWYANFVAGQVIVVEEHPLSLLVPTREVATFTCKAFCDPNCCGDWLINGVGHHQNRLDFEQKGYTFHNDTTGSVHIMNMSVNASFMLNNTKIRCHFMHCGDSGFSVNSDIATLLVIESKKLEMLATHIIALVIFVFFLLFYRFTRTIQPYDIYEEFNKPNGVVVSTIPLAWSQN